MELADFEQVILLIVLFLKDRSRWIFLIDHLVVDMDHLLMQANMLQIGCFRFEEPNGVLLIDGCMRDGVGIVQSRNAEWYFQRGCDAGEGVDQRCVEVICEFDVRAYGEDRNEAKCD